MLVYKLNAIRRTAS